MPLRIPALRGIIDRRILANFRIDPEIMAQALPSPFRPKLVKGYAIGGICLIRLKDVRPRALPIPGGLCSENAAHRIAVEWDGAEGVEEGVFVPRRDTDSRLATWAGGTVFPGLHHLARFKVEENAESLEVELESHDGQARLQVSARVCEQVPATSVFDSLAEASRFFERGSLGYSMTDTAGRFDGLELRVENWRVDALVVDHVSSSYFEDEETFPSGSVAFDCALLMRGIEHEWHARESLCCPEAEGP